VLCASATAAPTAEDLFNAGQEAYDHGNYALAIDRWQESYRLSKEPALLYNLGQAYRLAGECKRALASYKQFVADDPTSERRPLADDLVRELEAKCGQSMSTGAAPRPVENTEATNSGRSLKVAGLVTGGAGVVLLATGLVFGRRASTLADEIGDACSQGCDWGEHRSKDSSGRRAAVIGYTLDGLGVAAIAAGAVMYYVGTRKSAVAVVPRSRQGGAAISWSTSW
jgi:tetratricopeptide (TPR) repeat protein